MVVFNIGHEASPGHCDDYGSWCMGACSAPRGNAAVWVPLDHSWPLLKLSDSALMIKVVIWPVRLQQGQVILIADRQGPPLFSACSHVRPNDAEQATGHGYRRRHACGIGLLATALPHARIVRRGQAGKVE
jgi:hypothetical protein